MSGWLALCDMPAPRAPDLAGGAGLQLGRGMFVAEIALPLSGPAVLIDCKGTDGGRALSFALFYDARVGLVLLHRTGSATAKHILAGVLPLAGLARLSFCFEAATAPGEGRWEMRLDRLDGTLPFAVRGTGALPLSAGLMAALAETPRHPSLLWWGLSEGSQMPQAEAWIGPRTPVATPSGLVAAANLRVGDRVLTERGPMPLRGARMLRVPGRGSFTPVLLRAPWFGQGFDLLVGPGQMVALSGAEVEYTFGEDEVLAPAGWLADNQAAIADDRRAAIEAVALDLGRPALIEAAGCRLLVPAASGALPARALLRFEALALRATLGRGAMARVA